MAPKDFNDSSLEFFVSITIDFHIYQFRYTFAVNLFNNGTDIGKLRQLMGHKDITMTAQYLREIPQKALKDDVDALSFHNML